MVHPLFINNAAEVIRFNQDVDNRRKSVLNFEENSPDSDAYWDILLQFDGAVFLNAFFHRANILSLTVWSTISILHKYELWNFMKDGSAWKAIAPVGAFLVFFLVFYANQCWNRYSTAYKISCDCRGRINDATVMCAAYLPKGPAVQIVRYMNAAHILGFVGLKQSDSYNSNFFRSMALMHNLLTPEESVAILNTNVETGSAYRLCILWACQVINANKDNMPGGILTALNNQCVGLRHGIGSLVDMEFQPVPYAYWNIISWLLIFYCPLIGFCIALTCAEAYWYIGFCGLLFLNLCFCGLTELAGMLAEPFGSDVNDFAVYHFVDRQLDVSREMFLRVMDYSPVTTSFQSAKKETVQPDGNLDFLKPPLDLGQRPAGLDTSGKYDPFLQHTSDTGQGIGARRRFLGQQGSHL